MRVGLVAGESSGDLLGAGLIREIRSQAPGSRFEGVAGPAMQAAGCEAFAEAEALAVMGLIEPLAEIPNLLRLRRSLVDRWRDNPPDVFVGIDAPDFNLGLEARLRELDIATVHYVSPSVWAWRQGRIRKIARAADKVLCLLPFEKDFYDRHELNAEFVGHPLADSMPENPDKFIARSSLGIDASRLVAVLPGSRASEVSRLGPVFAATAARLAREHAALRFAAPMASDKLKTMFAKQLAAADVRERFTLTAGDAQTVIAASDVVLLASGTASLQTALLGRPMVALTYVIMKAFRLVKVPYFSLPNLLTPQPLVPEFLQGAANPPALAAAISGLLRDPSRCSRIVAEFQALREKLSRQADRRAAAAVLEVAHAATA